MNEHNSLEELVVMARGELRPLAAERREAMLAEVLATARPLALPAVLPFERAARRRRPVVLGVVLVAVAAAAAVVAYWQPWSGHESIDTTAMPPAPARERELSPAPEPPPDDRSMPPAPAPSPDEQRAGGTAPRPRPPSRVGGAPPAPPAPLSPPQILAPSVFAANQASGDRRLFPDDATKAAIAAAGIASIVIPVKVCVDDAGQVSSVNVLKTSGFAAYDELLVRGVQAWAFRPFTINGAVAPVCSIVQFVYSQR